MMTPDERYTRDPVFKHMVDLMETMITQAQMTPTEIREAAVLAYIHYEIRRPTRYMIPKEGGIEDIRRL